jgi:hypothetical protein
VVDAVLVGAVLVVVTSAAALVPALADVSVFDVAALELEVEATVELSPETEATAASLVVVKAWLAGDVAAAAAPLVPEAKVLPELDSAVLDGVSEEPPPPQAVMAAVVRARTRLVAMRIRGLLRDMKLWPESELRAAMAALDKRSRSDLLLIGQRAVESTPSM